MTVADEVRKRMKAQGLTPKGLSKKAVGLNETYVRDLLAGKSQNPRTEHLRKLADALGCTIDDLTNPTGENEGDAARAAKIREAAARLNDLPEEYVDLVLHLIGTMAPQQEPKKAPEAPDPTLIQAPKSRPKRTKRADMGE